MKATDSKPANTFPAMTSTTMLSALVKLLLVTVVALLGGETVLLVWKLTTVGNVVYFTVFALGLVVVSAWTRRRVASQHRGDAPVPGTHVTVHTFVAHLKMHPALLPEGMTEADLEYFRKQFSGNHQEDVNTWTQWVQEWRKQPS